MTINLVGHWPKELASAINKVERVLSKDSKLNHPTGIINLKLVDDDEIKALNKRYSGNAYSTDVLTFTYDDSPTVGTPKNIGQSTIADVVISLPTATVQARQAETGLDDEVALLALHGILHAIGRDHPDERSQQQLDTDQARILKSAGLKYRNFNWEQ
jgi:probable rRNA maturation factor